MYWSTISVRSESTPAYNGTFVKSDLSSVHVYSSVHRTSHFIQGTRKTQPWLTYHPVGHLKESLQSKRHKNRPKTILYSVLHIICRPNFESFLLRYSAFCLCRESRALISIRVSNFEHFIWRTLYFQVQRTKGTHLFSLDVVRTQTLTGESAAAVRMVVSVREAEKKIILKTDIFKQRGGGGFCSLTIQQH